MQDDCHRVWGDGCARVWGKGNSPIAIRLTNPRDRPTYYGAVNRLTPEFHRQDFSAGQGEYSVPYLRWRQAG
jgi:hypothetical protein